MKEMDDIISLIPSFLTPLEIFCFKRTCTKHYRLLRYERIIESYIQ